MKKKINLLIGILCLLISSFVEAQLLSNTSFTTPNAGWYQVGKWESTQRGSDRIAISLYGGAHAPQELVVDVFKNWTSAFTIDVKGARNSNLQQVRVTKDDVNYYLEVYFNLSILNSGNIHHYALGGKKSGFTINSGELPASISDDTIYESGNVIYTTSIDNTIDARNNLLVNGTTTLNNELIVNGDITNSSGSGGTLTLFDDDATRRNRVILGADEEGAYLQSTWGSGGNDAISFKGSGGDMLMHIDRYSNVGIGTTETEGYKLAVAGETGIVAEKVTVKLMKDWPDFVFTKEYELPTIKEVEKHIEEKGHLIDIPNASEVKEKGIELGDMNKKLLQKIEELTLYTIQQEKQLNIQREDIRYLKEQKNKKIKLEQENEVLKSLIERLNKLEELIGE